MATEAPFSSARPVNDLYSPPGCGELDEIADQLADGRLSGGAPVVLLYERALAEWFGVKRAVAVNSGTSALHATLIALGVGAGDEVLVPATAPLPTALPVLTCGAIPVIVDTAPGSLALNPADVSAKITDRTRGAITLPLWGYPADDTAAMELLNAASIPVIEDACQAHGTKIRGRYAGTIGRAGCFSTHDRKLLSTGEGGFVLTDDEDLAEKIDYYTHLGHLGGAVHGVNYKIAGPLAAIGLRRLPGLQAQQQARRANAARLLDALSGSGVLTELGYRHGDLPNYYNLVLVADPDCADAAATMLAAAGLPPDSIRYGYRPLYRRPVFATYATECPNAEALAITTLQLPVHPGLTETALQWAADQLRSLATAERQRT
jgi:perosamine synthetase